MVECVGGWASTHFIQLLQAVEISEDFPRPIDPFRLDLHLRSRRSVIYRQHQRTADVAYWIYLREEDATVVSTLAFVFDLLELLHCTRIPITSTWHLRTKRSEAVSLLVWIACPLLASSTGCVGKRTKGTLLAVAGGGKRARRGSESKDDGDRHGARTGLMNA